VDQAILLELRHFRCSFLDLVFIPSHFVGLLPVFAVLVLGAAAGHARARRAGRAGVWLGLGVLVLVSMEVVKEAARRARPTVVAHLVAQGGYSFPSGHALASAALYPLLARELAERWPDRRKLFMGLAILGSVWLGVGRLYLGVHWPSDVLGGWVMGGLEGAAGLVVFERAGGERTSAAPRGSD
jgi:undecaprenyl-diphosphatase